MHKLQGRLDAHKGQHFAICASRFNEPVVDGLLQGCHETLLGNGVEEKQITLISVPGAVELPLTAQLCAESGNYAAVICLGAVIKGETAHFEYVSEQAAMGLLEAGLKTRVPVIFGVITTYTAEQARARSAPGHKNSGAEAAQVALEMADLVRKLKT